MAFRSGLLAFLFAICSLGAVRAQSVSDVDDLDPFFQSWGASTFIDYIRGPATSFETSAGRQDYFQPEGFSYLTAAYRARMNLARFFDDMALSSSVAPAIGASFFRFGYVHFNLPILVNLEIGAKATKDAELGRFGVVGGIGYEFHAAPLIVRRNRVPLPSDTKLQNTWLQPVYKIGLRYKRGSRLIELNLKYGEGQGTFTQGKTVRARTIRVMAFYYI